MLPRYQQRDKELGKIDFEEAGNNPVSFFVLSPTALSEKLIVPGVGGKNFKAIKKP